MGNSNASVLFLSLQNSFNDVNLVSMEGSNIACYSFSSKHHKKKFCSEGIMELSEKSQKAINQHGAYLIG